MRRAGCRVPSWSGSECCRLSEGLTRFCCDGAVARESEATKAVGRAAREVLRPLGLVQKGRSRTWLDDHGWWGRGRRVSAVRLLPGVLSERRRVLALVAAVQAG